METEQKSYADIYSDWISRMIRTHSPAPIQSGEQLIVVPVLDRHNDFLSVIVKQYDDGVFYVSDGGFLFDDACDITDAETESDFDELKQMFGEISAEYRLNFSEDGELFDWSDTIEELPEAITHFLTKCIVISTEFHQTAMSTLSRKERFR